MELCNHVMKNESKGMFSVDILPLLSSFFVNVVFDVVIKYSRYECYEGLVVMFLLTGNWLV